MNDPNHPIWPLLRIIVILTALVTILFVNASHFDKTEIQTVITMFLALLGTEGITKYLTRNH